MILDFWKGFWKGSRAPLENPGTVPNKVLGKWFLCSSKRIPIGVPLFWKCSWVPTKEFPDSWKNTWCPEEFLGLLGSFVNWGVPEFFSGFLNRFPGFTKRFSESCLDSSKTLEAFLRCSKDLWVLKNFSSCYEGSWKGFLYSWNEDPKHCTREHLTWT